MQIFPVLQGFGANPASILAAIFKCLRHKFVILRMKILSDGIFRPYPI
jgi:hypothetical protein